jgi:ADP-heptose:LPS heptosyltransferase
MTDDGQEVLVHIGAGIGNVILATPLLAALNELRFTIDVWLTADYAETSDLLQPWSVIRSVQTSTSLALRSTDYCHIIPAIPPFYWPRYASAYSGSFPVLPRPSDSLFYQNEQEYYLNFARRLGYPIDRSLPVCLPIAPSQVPGVSLSTLIIAPGCKTGEMASKRWPHYAELADQFLDVAVVGTADDLARYNGEPIRFGPHVKMFVDHLTLRETAGLIAAAGGFVGNDSGLSHIAAAVGTPAVMIFGPTSEHTLGRLAQNVRILRRGYRCEPCWFDLRFRACAGRIDCLAQVTVGAVVAVLGALGFPGTTNKISQ